MGVIVVTGAMMLCPFGTAPANLSVTSQSVVLAEGKAVATIQDSAPNVNIPGSLVSRQLQVHGFRHRRSVWRTENLA